MVGSFISTVEAFDHLLVRTKFSREFISFKTNYLCDMESEVILEPFDELHCSQRICTVHISHKTEVFRKFFRISESHARGKDAGIDTMVSDT